jgi:hypothetical protein
MVVDWPEKEKRKENFQVLRSESMDEYVDEEYTYKVWQETKVAMIKRSVA